MLVRYRQPWFLSSRVNNEFDRLIAETFGRVEPVFTPPADVSTQGNDVVIALDVPGVAPEDVDVTLEGRFLKITGTRASAQVAEGDRYLARGRFEGSFARTYRVPEGTTPEQVSATVDNGQLIVRVADVTKPEPQPQKIAVTRAAESQALESGETE
ncbi:Hsp20/alpha crystallin family protein [Stackebrandtia nassauensis]|uniref:Heat shock protein Hsp20 n=1 Tax=Stackebrandtia nassauensis (strain DSM 44728 / CIP 108903 / NRRL B-16338 / NBRC 102104 / LLR-40K-21) TaxID=446470 RepID=D3Q547_STANL|nr:Hsp20/alpha crystallin family protein [Stackebrandtia nassauensis]ADD44096.1 heat shock protein Hsp20 [Stackebrandtia nassauensis DSM 44728]